VESNQKRGKRADEHFPLREVTFSLAKLLTLFIDSLSLPKSHPLYEKKLKNN
jgi:hypothetical protein